MKIKEINELKSALKEANLKVTPRRLDLLSILSKERKPVTVFLLEKKLGKNLNQVTIYRALEDLTKAGIVKMVDFEHGHAHYEIILGRIHHHHLVCETCGKVDDVEIEGDKKLEIAALDSSKSFSSVRRHSLEFFGQCKVCLKRS